MTAAPRIRDRPGATGPDGEYGEFGIYVHWPFCQSKCPYCDFNSHVRDHVDEDRWRRAYLAEIDTLAGEFSARRRLGSVFFGGGTPSLMAPDTVAAILSRLFAHWPADENTEVTLEANPTSAEAANFAAYRDAGVNRLSIGVQSLDDDALAFLGRAHDGGEAEAAVALAARHFDRYSFDLIYALPDQTVAAWKAQLDRALALAGNHLSVYQLTIEPGTRFHTLREHGALALPDAAISAPLFEATQDKLGEAGFPAYEISNHARPGGECRHNLTYWRYGEYLGIGPGAHGRMRQDGGTVALARTRSPEAWLAQVEATGNGEATRDALGQLEIRDELAMMGLRLNEGIGRTRFRDVTGGEIEDGFDGDRLAPLIAGGFLALDAMGLRASAAGRQRLDAVLAALLA